MSPDALRGDGDPLDICVVSERPINRAEIVLNAVVVGGLQMVDDEEADDKIIAVLQNDHMWGGATDVSELPSIIVERLHHYFMTYKHVQTDGPQPVEITSVYGREHAVALIEAAMADYDEEYGE